MAISYVGHGANSSSQTAATPAIPAGVLAEDLLIIPAEVKRGNITIPAPSGWSLLVDVVGGAGAGTADEGTLYAAAFYKVASGGETGTISLAPSGASVVMGRCFALRKAAGTTWDIAAVAASDNAGGSPTLNFSFPADPGFIADDMAVVCVATNTDAYTHSGQVLTVPGCTEGTVTERFDNVTATGEDMSHVVSTHAIAGGTSTGNPSFAVTASGSATNSPAGTAILIRVREVASGGASATIASVVTARRLLGFGGFGLYG